MAALSRAQVEDHVRAVAVPIPSMAAAWFTAAAA
jgi:hypothetical protein